MSDKEITLEEAFNKLEELAGKMQGEDISLEESFSLYKEGVELIELCNNKIEKVETDIKKVNGNE